MQASDLTVLCDAVCDYQEQIAMGVTVDDGPQAPGNQPRHQRMSAWIGRVHRNNLGR
jgi:hypothetical protein